MGGESRLVRFVTREGCTLCEAAYSLLRSPARLLRIEIVEVDVDADPDLLAEYGGRVPVVLASDGSVLAEGRLERRDAWLAVWRGRRARGSRATGRGSRD